jgi:hypothetical protein
MARSKPWFTVQYIAVTTLGLIPYGAWREVNLWFSTAEKAQLWIRQNAEFSKEYSVCHNYGEVPKGMILHG